MGSIENRCFEFICILICLITLRIGSVANDDTTIYGTRQDWVNPCDDFYKHVCGEPGLRDSRAIKNFKRIKLKLSIERDALLKELLDHKETTKDDVFNKISKYYRSCMDFDAGGADGKGLKHLLSIVSKNGGWPLTFEENEWSIDNCGVTFQEIHQNYAEIVGRGALFDITVTSYGDPDKKMYEPMIRRAQQRFKYGSDDNIAGNMEVAQIFAESQQYKPNKDAMAKELEAMFQFGRSVTELNSSISNLTATISEIQTRWDQSVSGHPEFSIDWLKIIQQTFPDEENSFDETQKLYVTPHDLFEKLGELLIGYGQKTVVNWIHWTAIADLLPYADKTVAKFIIGPGQVSCFSGPMVDHGMWYLHVKKYYDDFPQLRPVVDDMISEIIKVLMGRIKNSAWMGKDMAERFGDKYDNMIRNIGYPKWYDEFGKIDAYLSDLNMGSVYLENRISWNRFRKLKSVQKLRRKFDRHEWIFSPIHVNAYYSPSYNFIMILLGIIQDPYFNVNKPRYLSDGALGTIIAHEIAHGIDPLGQLYNKIGYRKPLPEPYSTEYNKKMDCLIDQYNKYSYETIDSSGKRTVQIDGVRTLNENYADNVGIGLAWQAFQNNFADKKDFFYAYASAWCATNHHRPESPHAPAFARVNGVVSNMLEFSEVFSCNPGSPMNPENKCMFWQ